MEVKDIYDKYSTEQIDEFEKIAESKCCWGCKKRNKSCSDCELFLNERDGIVLLDYIKYLEKEIIKLKDDWALKRAELNSANQSVSILTQTKDSLERDKEVLEKALELACKDANYWWFKCAGKNRNSNMPDYSIEYYKKQVNIMKGDKE